MATKKKSTPRKNTEYVAMGYSMDNCCLAAATGNTVREARSHLEEDNGHVVNISAVKVLYAVPGEEKDVVMLGEVVIS